MVGSLNTQLLTPNTNSGSSHATASIIANSFFQSVILEAYIAPRQPPGCNTPKQRPATFKLSHCIDFSMSFYLHTLLQDALKRRTGSMRTYNQAARAHINRWTELQAAGEHLAAVNGCARRSQRQYESAVRARQIAEEAVRAARAVFDQKAQDMRENFGEIAALRKVWRRQKLRKPKMSSEAGLSHSLRRKRGIRRVGRNDQRLARKAGRRTRRKCVGMPIRRQKRRPHHQRQRLMPGPSMRGLEFGMQPGRAPFQRRLPCPASLSRRRSRAKIRLVPPGVEH